MQSDVKILPLGKDTWQIQDGEGSSCIYLYLLAGDERAMLIDTGLWNIDAAGIAQSLTAKPVFAVNTHGHLDHISANDQFEEVYLHPADEDVFAQHSSYEVRLAFARGLMAEQGLPVSLLDEPPLREKTQRACSLAQRENRKPLQDGMVFDLGGRHVRVVETPGHTLGSVCLLDEENRWLFSGDTVCDQGVLLHFPHSAPVAVFLESVRKLQALSGQYDVIWPGHHRFPLEKEILRRYASCAQRLIQGEQGTPVTSAAGAAMLLSCEGIALSVPIPENCQQTR